MTRRFIDISIPLENDVVSDPPAYAPRIEYFDHHASVPGLAAFFPGLTAEDLPDQEAWSYEKIELITHNGTHLDAPYHFASTMNRGERAITIDEVPLDWCFRPGVKLDFRDLPDGHVITAQEVEAELERIDYEIQPFDIVVVNTRAGGRYGHDDYLEAGIGMGHAATLYLLEKGVRLTGTDAWSYCHLEKLHNLEVLPPTGFTVSCFPVKIRGASAGWTRAVAIIDELEPAA
jgi:kynurenine formamidase